jgi:hypothetical protein
MDKKETKTDKKESKNEKNVESDEDDDDGLELNENLYYSIKETFDEEVNKLIKKITAKYGEEYMFVLEDLQKFYKGCNIQMVYKKAPKKKQKASSPDSDGDDERDDSERCCARIWNGGYMDKKTNTYGGRCQRKKIYNEDFCRQHSEDLVHGRFDDQPSKIVRGFFIKENSNR